MKFNQILLLGAFLALASCTNEKASDSQADWLGEMESELAENPSDEKIVSYLSVLDSLINSDVTNAERNSKLLSRASAFQYNLNRIQSSIDLLSRSLKSYPDVEGYKENLLLLNELGAKFNKDLLLDSLNKKLVELSFDSEGNRMDNIDSGFYLEAIESTQQDIYSNSNNPNFKMARRYVQMVEYFSLVNPADSNVPNLLYEGGKVAELIKNSVKAVELFEWCNSNYPESDIAPANLFMLAFTCEDGLNDDGKAATYYKTFMEKYPDHEMYSSAEFLLSNIDKTDEEILNELRKQ
jgi:tetratricopeptide (TPR) repeat protein